MRKGDTVCVTVPDSGVRQALTGRSRVGRKFCGSKTPTEMGAWGFLKEA